jgi:hypothetical protein
MRKRILSILAVVALSLMLPISAFAATREVSVYLYRDYADCVFFVSWQNAEQSATIKIKAPDDAIIDATAQNADFGKGRATVSVGNAGSGYWTVFVDGDNLGTISVSGGSKNTASTQYNAVQSFSADVANGYINFEWSAIAEQDTINVSISATQGGNNGSRTVYSDYSASKSGTASVSADDLQTGL